jgi:tetratricopeptide (TPR) repeat protein
MKGPKKEKVKLSEQGVVTEEALIAFLHDELSPEEKQELEKLLLQDPFAADALEGLKTSSNQTAVTSSISSLNKKVRERSGLKERKKLQVHWITYAWAAVVVGLLIGISFILVNFLNKPGRDLAQNEKKAKPELQVAPLKDTTADYETLKTPSIDSLTTAGAKAIAADSGVVTVSNGATASYTYTTSVTDQTDQAKQDFKKDKIADKDVSGKVTGNTGLSFTPTTGTQNSLKEVTNSSAGEKNNKNAVSKSTVIADSTNVTYGWSAANAPQPVKADAYKRESKPEVKDMASMQDDAMKSFNAGDYNTSGDNFDKILKSDPNNDDALYFGGICDYINGKTAKSEINFDKLLKKGNKYIEGAKWYKANILLKKGKSDAAKVLLQDLSNGNSSYKERAIKKLAEMGF